MNTVISNNVIRRARQAAIQYRGFVVDGGASITGNQVVHSGYPNQTPPGPESRRPIDPSKPGYGRGIYIWTTRDVQITGNTVAYSRGPAISSIGSSHVIVTANVLSVESAGMNNQGITIQAYGHPSPCLPPPPSQSTQS